MIRVKGEGLMGKMVLCIQEVALLFLLWDFMSGMLMSEYSKQRIKQDKW